MFAGFPGVVVTAWQVLAEVGSAEVGGAVLVDALASEWPGGVVSGRVLRVDAVHDLAVGARQQPARRDLSGAGGRQ